MALAALSGDEQCIIFSRLCNVLDPDVAVAFGSTSSELRAVTQAQRQQLRADHEAATALCLKLGKQSCKELREAKRVYCSCKRLSVDDLATLGTLSSVLPALKDLLLFEPTAGPDGVQRLAERLGAGALPAVSSLRLQDCMHVGDAGASALAVALGRGALPRLMILWLTNAPSATRGWWPSRRPCGGGPRWSISISLATLSATRASPPSWRRRRRRQVRCRRRLEC